ncbi:hypothetical protein [Pasteurella sp. PK-2025]|uniref:hypothetical protein n=1 Tax=Pasteurella sp. PK-2025 TaxID=3413133 RepID=UPI003C794D60
MARTEYDGDIGGGYDRERTVHDDGSRSDWSGGWENDKDHDEDRHFGSSNRLEPTHPAYNPVGGESVSDEGRSGWEEHESGNGYVNTNDRMNNHLNRYGADKGYTNSFNEGRGAISSAIASTRQFLSATKDDHAKKVAPLTGGGSAGLLANNIQSREQIRDFNNQIRDFVRQNNFKDENDLRQQVEKRFGFGALEYHNLQDQIKELRDTPFSTFQSQYRGSALDTIENRPRDIAGNFVGQHIGGLGAGAVTNALAKVNPVAGVVGGSILSALSGRAGTIYNNIENENRVSSLNNTLKQANALGRERGERELERNKSKILSGLEAVSSIGSFVPAVAPVASVIGLGANWANTEHSVSNSLKNLSYDPEARSRYEARVARHEKRTREEKEFEQTYGKNNDGGGILATLSHRLNHLANQKPKEQPKPLDVPYYGIPSIENLWGKVKVKEEIK